MYPPIAIREFVANALIHQDFYLGGSSPMIEIFGNRMEISNPGKPLIDIFRFIDHTPISRNEKLASLMSRMNICEERGCGVDRTITQCELYQLPAPDFQKTIYSQRSLCRDCRLMFSIRPKQPTDPIHFCVRVTKFPFYISFRSFRPDYLSIFNGRGVVPP